MADEKEKLFQKLAKRVRVPRRLIPKKFLVKMELLLVKAYITFSATEWIGIFIAFGIPVFIIVSILVNILVGLGAFVMIMVIMYAYPVMQANKRMAQVEDFLPDALHHMSVSIKTGLVLDAVIQEISDSDYGALSDEFSKIVLEMRRGRPLKEALLAFSKRTGSKQIERAIRLLVEGIEVGGPISDVLEEVAEDIRAVRVIQRERRSLTMQQISFVAIASLMAGPFVMGVAASLPTIMKAAVGNSAQAAQYPLKQLAEIVQALSFYVVAQAVAAALMIGVVMYGDMRKGLKFAPPMALIAYLIFYVIKTFMPGMLGTF
ncbi:MAG TPA: hypothetical protein ENI78_00060 [Euryarchaeota archaeon]|nr:hypothetical protein [Euryarchaeota archaeon]